jgi:hypothetical protein
MQQFDTLNRQQQPFIQSGYGAMGKLNTLLGIGGRMGGGAPGGGAFLPNTPNAGQAYRPRPNGGMQQIVGSAPQGMQGNARLKQILMLRAQNGDTEAARVLGGL